MNCRLLLALASIAVLAVSGCTVRPAVREADIVRCGGASGRACQLALLAIEPNDGDEPLLTRFAEAKTSIDYAPFELNDQPIAQALAAARARGVRVRVLLEPQPEDDPGLGARAGDLLTSLGIEWQRTNPSFSLSHAKYAVLDGTRALILTFNSTASDFRSCRDFGIVDDDPDDARFMQALFEADWAKTKALTVPTGFAVSPDNSNTALIRLVDSAQRTLDIYAERLEPSPLFDAILRAVDRGVTVRVLGAPIGQKERQAIGFGELTRGHRFDFRTPDQPRIHAKVMIADGTDVFLGSENVEDSPGERRRELGIIFADPSISAQLSSVFEQDWQATAPAPWQHVGKK
jgi:phosphatidylserine/phosphatidylglycerophosphate/cardiolipin synthase-like enzyme